MSNTIFWVAATVVVAIIVDRKMRELAQRKVFVDELDKILGEILGDCLEAYCEDCDGILAQGTGQYKEDVFTAAYNHGEVYDHEVRVRSWAD